MNADKRDDSKAERIAFKGQHIAVVGMQKSGFGAAELLLRQGARVRAIDGNPTAKMRARCGQLGIELAGQSAESLSDVDLIVLSPAVKPHALPAHEAPVIGEVELAGYFLQGPAIGITGSNGKTTTTALIGHILKESGIPSQVGGNIGVAPTSMIESSRPEQWNVLELSSFQLTTIHKFHATVGVITNLTPDHIDWHGSFEAYAGAKARLFETQHEGEYAVLNADDPITSTWDRRTKASPVWFSLNGPVEGGTWLGRDGVLYSRGDRVMLAAEIPMPGRHNVENVAAAISATRLAGATPEQIRAAVMSFPGVEHRIEFVRELAGVRYYNDSKATNVDATMKAIDAFPGGLWIILGGKDKGSDYTVLGEPLRAKAHAALLIGAAAEKIASQLGDAVLLIRSGDIQHAVRTAHNRATAGDIVLLAPACASFDQFQSYEHRGRMFKELVKAL
jgi:UDP-N-acetylmuramoylalanine--D-glutamate ligase